MSVLPTWSTRIWSSTSMIHSAEVYYDLFHSKLTEKRSGFDHNKTSWGNYQFVCFVSWFPTVLTPYPDASGRWTTTGRWPPSRARTCPACCRNVEPAAEGIACHGGSQPGGGRLADEPAVLRSCWFHLEKVIKSFRWYLLGAFTRSVLCDAIC